MLLAFALSLLLPQEPSFERGDPSGVVVDEQGIGVAGAEVRIVRAPVPGRGRFEQAIEQVLRKQPLRPVLTRVDGGYVVPLSRDQRRLGTLVDDGRFWLRVKKEGHASAFEELYAGVAGWRGSRIVLTRARPEDACELQIADVRPGMLLSLYWSDGRIDSSGETVSVPANGRVAITRPQVLLTRDPTDPAQAPGLWLMVQTLHPGRCSDPLAIHPDGAVIEVPCSDTRDSRNREVTRKDGAEVIGMRGRYLARDGSEHSFALEGTIAPDSPALQLMALTAEHCHELLCDGSSELVLVPSNLPPPAHAAPCRVRVVDDGGRAIAGATLRCSDSCFALGDVPEAATVTGADGSVHIARLPIGAHIIVAIVEGHLVRRTSFDHAADRAELVITLPAARDLHVLAVDRDGRPVQGCFVHEEFAHAGSLAMRDFASDPLRTTRTDDSGRATLRDPLDEPGSYVLAGQPIVRGDPAKPVRVVVDGAARRLVWLPSLEMRAFEFKDGETQSSTAPRSPFFRVPPTALLVRAFTHPDGAFSLGIIDAPPVRVTARDLLAGGAALDRRHIVRRVPLVLPDKLPDLRIVASLMEPNGEPDLALGNAAARATDGSWSFVARDQGTWRCLALASGYEPFSFTMPARAADGAEPPLTLALKRKP